MISSDSGACGKSAGKAQAVTFNAGRTVKSSYGNRTRGLPGTDKVAKIALGTLVPAVTMNRSTLGLPGAILPAHNFGVTCQPLGRSNATVAS